MENPRKEDANALPDGCQAETLVSIANAKSGAKDALDRLEAETHALTAAVDKQAEMLRVANERLDAIIALLTPKEPDENGLSDLLARLVMIGGEQLALAQRSFALLASIDERLPHATEDDDILPRHGARPL